MGPPDFSVSNYFVVQANLTYAMKHFFPDSFGIDHKVNKQRVKIICLDLSKEDHQQLVEQWALSGRCLWVHFGTPCGTASRARFRRISRKIHGPPPLRTPKFPDGLPGLKGVHAAKLRAANRLYSYMRRLIKQLHAAKVVWTVENPFTSLLWETSYWKDIAVATAPFYCELHNCMFGGTRLKRTCLASNSSAVMSLKILCDGSHEHAPWSINNGVFDTSLEAEYTPTFAKALATAILEPIACEYKIPNVVQHAKKLKLSHFQAIAAEKQPTKAMRMPTVPEFAFLVIICNLPLQFAFPVQDHTLQSCTTVTAPDRSLTVPCQSKLLRKTYKKGGENRLSKMSTERMRALKALSDTLQHHLAEDLQSRERRELCGQDPPCRAAVFNLQSIECTEACCDWVFGTRWSPQEFLQCAVEVGHPFSVFSGLPAEVKAACEHVACSDPVQLINHRCSKLGQWLRLSKQLQSEEDALKAAMPEQKRKILFSKRLCLMKRIVLDEGYDDQALATDVEQGFSLVGDVPRSNVLPEKLLPATISTTDLTRNAGKANVALRYMTRSSGSHDLDLKLWEKTLLEVDRGWLVGPLDWEALGDDCTLSRRFPLEQSGKVRPIDDLSQSQIDATVTCFEQLRLMGLMLFVRLQFT